MKRLKTLTWHFSPVKYNEMITNMMRFLSVDYNYFFVIINQRSFYMKKNKFISCGIVLALIVLMVTIIGIETKATHDAYLAKKH